VGKSRKLEEKRKAEEKTLRLARALEEQVTNVLFLYMHCPDVDVLH
jgi:cytochrome oxidase Cu insertion factor (SCO1/SenC/PrrC family)